MFSIGDTHATQGDGEVCGTAIECAMQVSVTLDLIKDTPWPCRASAPQGR
nr:acetamidase/formamidase family protein [Halomonas populi]